MIVETMRVFHRTSDTNATKIIEEGFRDGKGNYLTDFMWVGVWVSDTPLHANDGVIADVLLRLDVPKSLFEAYEWIEEGKGYREPDPSRKVERIWPAENCFGQLLTNVHPVYRPSWSTHRWQRVLGRVRLAPPR